jgi:hypothetical protein
VEEGAVARIIELMPETPVSRYRLNARTKERLERLRGLMDKTEAEILEDAVAHLLGTLERDQPIWPTAPSDRQTRHKRPPRDAA